jgi:hypothetical protein
VIGGVVALATTGPNASEKSTGSTNSSSPSTTAPTSEAPAPTTRPAPKPIKPRAVSAAQLAALPQATTEGRIDGAPADSHPTSITDGSVVHPTRTVPIFGRPGGGPAIGALPATEVAGPTWVPIVGRAPGWLQVLLPSKPNGRVGWLAEQGADNGGLQTARSTYQVRVNLTTFKLSLFNNNQQVGQWTVGTGSTVDPTPPGRTFILGAFTDPQQNYSPVILPLGVHSPSLDTFGGGAGTGAIHTRLKIQQRMYSCPARRVELDREGSFGHSCPDSLIDKAPFDTYLRKVEE